MLSILDFTKIKPHVKTTTGLKHKFGKNAHFLALNNMKISSIKTDSITLIYLIKKV